MITKVQEENMKVCITTGALEQEDRFKQFLKCKSIFFFKAKILIIPQDVVTSVRERRKGFERLD